MDFFDKQARASKKTKWLVCYFLLAVLGIILTLHIAFALIFGLSPTDPELFLMVSAGVVGMVTLGSVVKSIELSKGGRAVAAMLGGTPVDMNSREPAEQRLINVVEEMSIASGVPVPEIYVLEDQTINAFAAGHGPGDAAIGVTRGCIDRLTRDELQGVIGHEFSHIIHGDMRLNIRLIGVLNGILFLALIGGFLLRMGIYSPRSDSSDGRSKATGFVVFVGGGLTLYLVGWIGVFFGKLIKAAVSRQREFLADASSVQYTRNPEGLAGALAKIAKFSSRIDNPRAEEASHMYFGNGIGDSWLAMFSTHPPIEERIQEIAPGFDIAAAKASAPVLPSTPKKQNLVGGRLAEALLPGQPRVAEAAALLAGLPDVAKSACRELHGACALVYSLLLPDEESQRERAIALIDADDVLRAEILAHYEKRAGLNSAQRLGLVDIAIPTLRHLSHEQYAVFRSNVKKLVEADGEIQLFEYTLQKILVRHLDLYFSNATGTKVVYKSLLPLLPEAGILLSVLASVDPGTDEHKDAAFRSGVSELLVKPSAFPLERAVTIDLLGFDSALDKIAMAAPDVKRTILTACGAVVMHDGEVNDYEVEFLRAISDTLDCPVPPFVRIA
ncbi:MAG: M48 family metallopeptidase [Verrucomicrobia bacterium]|nr:M48 family metallopeptidase [Verrucomicrobiota bacterium]